MNNYAEDKTLGKIELYNIKNFLHKLQKKFNKVFELLVLQLNFNKVGRNKIENIFHTIEASGSLYYLYNGGIVLNSNKILFCVEFSM